MRVSVIATGFAAALSLAIGAAFAADQARELKSGPQVGEILPAFTVTKAAGAPNDGVKVGDVLCYRCRMGNRPMVMVFAHKTDSGLISLTKQLDNLVAKNKEKKMGSFVSLLGDKSDDLKSAAKQFVDDNKIENVAVVVPEENAKGPSDYKLSTDADVTVLIYVKGKVEANYALSAGGLTDDTIKKIVADTSKILN